MRWLLCYTIVSLWLEKWLAYYFTRALPPPIGLKRSTLGQVSHSTEVYFSQAHMKKGEAVYLCSMFVLDLVFSLVAAVSSFFRAASHLMAGFLGGDL